MKKILIGALMMTLIGPAAAQNFGDKSDPDMAELMSIKTDYERAADKNQFDLLGRHVSPEFQGKFLFQNVNGREALENTWKKIQGDSKGQKVSGYKLKIITDDILVIGDRATARGKTEESIKTPGGLIRFESIWTAKLQKQDGKWMITGMEANLNPANAASQVLQGVAKNLWSGISLLRGVNVEDPDYDRDGKNGGRVYRLR